MRPGPGLVVMALAFISGARRGSTSSISSKTTTTTTTSPPTQLLATKPPLTSSSTLFQTTATTSPTTTHFAIYKTSLTSTSSSVLEETTAPPIQSNNIYENFGSFDSQLVTKQQDDPQHHSSKRSNFFSTFFTQNSYASTLNYFAYSFPLPSHLRQHYDNSRARTASKRVLHSVKLTRRANRKHQRRRRRRTRSASVELKGTVSGSDDTAENLNVSDDTLPALTTVIDSSSDRTQLARGLPVHFSSVNTGDTSRSLDEDDIFALVAEDDLLSEESFDHLVKLTNDKIGDTNEEDYSSGTETVVDSSSGSGSGASDNVANTSDQQNAREDFVHEIQQQQPEPEVKQQLHKQNENSKHSDGKVVANVYFEGNERPNGDHDSEQDVIDTIYNAHLVGNNNEDVVLLKEADLTHTIPPDTTEKQTKQATTISSPTLSKAALGSANKYNTILDSNFALTRLNPWISACDLAQPGPIAAPDLQGECSAGTLPVAWVDEGPGPPTCPKSCKEETPLTNKLNKDNMSNYLINNNSINNKNSQSNKIKNDNKLNKLVGYTTTTNTFNIKLRNSQPTTSDSMNTNDNNNSNNKNINDKNINIIQKLLNPFKYYQINNNNNKQMAKSKRNLKQTSDRSDVETKSTNIMNDTQRNNKLNDSQSQAMSLHSREDYDLLKDMLMQQDETATNKHGDHQFNDAAIETAAIAMQIDQQQKQQQQESHNNNDVVKTKLTATTYSDNNSQHNNRNNPLELKYNHMKQDHLGGSRSNNNNNNNINSKRYQSNNINNSQKRSDILPTATKITSNNTVAANNQNSDQYMKISPPELEQQQCLEYLGESDKTMPMHLCHLLTPSDRLAQLRHLRLRNCCERNVYSALHTLALNATLSGGTKCLRVLEDLMDLDALASRITCGLTEILFRFDCRQVYSIIHQCDDCKEAYRRWVCSTLVPYFAETSDVMKPPEILTTTMRSKILDSAGKSNDVNSSSQSHKSHDNSLKNNNNTTMASNMTTSHSTATLPNNNNSNNNNNGTDMSSVKPLKIVTSNFFTNNNNNNENRMQYDASNLNMKQAQQEKHHVERRNTQQQQRQHRNTKFVNKNNSSSSTNDNNIKTILNQHKNQLQQQRQLQQQQPITINTTPALTFNDIIAHSSQTSNQWNSLILTLRQKSRNKRQIRSDNSTTRADTIINRPSIESSSSSYALHHKQRQKENQQQQSIKFISTANNEDSFYIKNSVISKLLKRSKRKKFEFRKRRRIRPCLSVCQTVEQKCPYLLPADRAPSMPTQYAGEPTFLCLDYNVAETEEQLKKASHGLSDCCYTYCSSSANGICTYCDDMWDKTEIDREAEILNEKRETKVFNITMKTKGQKESDAAIRVETKIQQKIGEENMGLKMSTVAIVVRNDTALENATHLAESLQYYAFCDGVFYYDDNTDDMPEYPNSENCRQLPPVQSRCSIPYFATNYISSADMLGSYRKNKEGQRLLIWLSALLCLWSCYNARYISLKRYNQYKRQQQIEQQEQQHKLNDTTLMGGNIVCQRCQTREIMQSDGKCIQKIIELWFDYRESRVSIIHWLTTKNRSRALIEHRKSHLRQITIISSYKKILKIFDIFLLILLINYKKIFFLLSKKREKLRKGRITYTLQTQTTGMALTERSWDILRHSSVKNLKSKSKYRFIKKNKIYYYYYCSCSQMFSCSCNKNMENNIYYNNDKYLKKFKINFSTCNFKINNNKINNKHNNNNKIIIILMKIANKQISIIKFNTNIITTHIFIKNSYNYNKKIYCYNIIVIIIIISYNINNNSDNKKSIQILKSICLNLNNTHYHFYNNYNYSDYLNYYYCNNNIYFYITKFNFNKMINCNSNNKVLFKKSTSTFTLTLKLPTTTSTFNIMITLYNLFNSHIKIKIMLMIIIMIFKMLLRFIMSLLFKSFIKKMKYDNNHHMKNFIKSKLSLSLNASYNSKTTNYRYFYYYNFNTNDWWQRRRWCRRRRRLVIHRIMENINFYNSRASLLSSGLINRKDFVQHILL